MAKKPPATPPARRLQSAKYTVNRNGPFTPDQGERYGKALAALLEARKNVDSTVVGLRPQDVVDAARAADSPLHDAFEWDVRKAAERHWLATARSLLNHIQVYVVYLDPQDQTQFTTKKGWFSVEAKEGARTFRVYVPRTTALSNQKMRESVFEQFEASARRFLEIAADFKDPDEIAMAAQLQTLLAGMRNRYRRRAG